MKSTVKNPCWFESWFDSKYYHLMYQHRDEKEADDFISKIIDFFQPANHAKVLDLACGKGRHAIALNNCGLDVTGIDLSAQSILDAKKNEKEGLEFFIQDMRSPFRINYFDYTFNLFTSFGYFLNVNDNRKVVKAVSSGLKKDGIFVIDFLNERVVRKIVKENNSGMISEGGIDFHWEKRIENNFVLKEIEFVAENSSHKYSECVQLLQLSDFRNLLEPYFSIEHIFGDYNLGDFDEEKSSRLIIIAKKK